MPRRESAVQRPPRRRPKLIIVLLIWMGVLSYMIYAVAGTFAHAPEEGRTQLMIWLGVSGVFWLIGLWLLIRALNGTLPREKDPNKAPTPLEHRGSPHDHGDY